MKKTVSLIALLFILVSCTTEKNTFSEETNTKEFTASLQEHLDAMTNKNIEIVEATVPKPTETMHLILPDGTEMKTAKEFIEMHREWFKDTISNWKLTFNIKYAHTNKDMGYALVEALLKEPNRNGKPYFHKMHVSYVLEKTDNKWLVIKDHASSIEKSE